MSEESRFSFPRSITLLAALMLSIAACGSPSSTGEPGPATVTLSDVGCTYAGPAEMSVEQLRIEMENETPGQFDLDLWLLDEGHDYEELAAHIEAERTRNEAGQPSLEHPAFATLVAEASAEAGSTGDLIADMAPGTYGIACIFFDRPGSLGGIWAAGPITVSE